MPPDKGHSNVVWATRRDQPDAGPPVEVRHVERRRHALIEDLLAGPAHDASFAARAARELNLPIEGEYLVVAVRGGDGRPLHGPGSRTTGRSPRHRRRTAHLAALNP
ncbi:hypothetical protein [Nocardia sp. NPDC050406]|uniref:hypothetical protein n=1 Tax=Nocardia sp. NPDC050406 TaxID=3364318 RepID=UPI0037BDBFA2